MKFSFFQRADRIFGQGAHIERCIGLSPTRPVLDDRFERPGSLRFNFALSPCSSFVALAAPLRGERVMSGFREFDRV